MRHATHLMLVAAAWLGTGCSTEQTYASGQAWQQGQCNKIVDMQERERCMVPTRESYDTYQRKAADLKKGNASE